MLRSFTGFRANAEVSSPLVAQRSQAVASARSPLMVVAEKKVKKVSNVVLTADVPGVGKAGQIIKVVNGYLRNYLAPNRLAAPVTPGILASIEAQKKSDAEKKAKVKAQAQQIATGLATIGKFIIKKKVGDADKIFGSVTAADIVDAVRQQTGKELDKKDLSVPEISKLGSYEVSVKLHPEVIGRFLVVVQKDTSRN